MVTPVEFESLALARGIEFRHAPSDALVIPTGEAIGLIALAQDLELVILGLDGLKLDGAAVVPLIDFIADFGGIAGPWEVRVRASASAAREALEKWGALPDLVEVTLDGIDE